MEVAPGFLAERLAAASAVPAEKRSADVRAFIEICRLQTELVEELGLPEAHLSWSQLEALESRWTAAAALKLVRSHFISLAGPLIHSPELHSFATSMVILRVRGTPESECDLGQEWTDILEGGPCLRMFAVLAAGLPTLNGSQRWARGLVKMSNSAVKLMQRPAVRRRLRAELAALPEQWVSYEELLAFFIDWGAAKADRIFGAAGWEASSDDLWTANRLAVGLLPLLTPGNANLRHRAALMQKGISITYPTTMAAVLEVARQQGSDYQVASCGYALAGSLEQWAAEAAAQQGVHRPSAVLGWLQQAEAAHARCRALLPKQWTSQLDGMKAASASAKPVLQRLQQEGDRWRQLGRTELRELNTAVMAHIDSCRDSSKLQRELSCSSCGKAAVQLRLCAGCREAQYCSVECQKAHWKEHKARCKQMQAAKTAAKAGAASGSGS